jgi:hypothetical protein
MVKFSNVSEQQAASMDNDNGGKRFLQNNDAFLPNF